MEPYASGSPAAVASVAIVYYLVEKSFGFVAAITAASMLACTPIFIAASRSNNPDAILAFILILSAWAVLVAAERGSILHLILAAILIGIGFNTKMLAAFNCSGFRRNVSLIKCSKASYEIDSFGTCHCSVACCFFFMDHARRFDPRGSKTLCGKQFNKFRIQSCLWLQRIKPCIWKSAK